MTFDRFYKKAKYDNTYYLPAYCRGYVWLFAVFLGALIYWFFFRSNFWLLIDFLVVCYSVLYIIGKCVVNHGLRNCYSAWKIKNKITYNLVNEKTKHNHVELIKVPGIKVTIEDDLISIKINKLAGMLSEQLDNLAELISSSLIGRFKNYAVSSSWVSDNGSYFEFEASEVGVNRAFTPTCLADLKQKSYIIKLQNGLEINLAESPHIVIWGQTGSGKTTLLRSVVAQCLSNGSKLLFLDGKDEFSAINNFYPSNRIASNNQAILKLLDYVCTTVIPKRQKIVTNVVRRSKSQQFGLRGYDIGLKPIVIIADELGSVVGSLNNKDKKLFNSCLSQITQKGRSISVFLVAASQSPSTDVLPSGVRSQFSTKILLGQADSNDQRMAFGESFKSGHIGKYQGYYWLSGRTVEPQRFYVPNLVKYDLDNVIKFKKLYENGIVKKD